jgi:hypothetical protein
MIAMRSPALTLVCGGVVGEVAELVTASDAELGIRAVWM